MVAKMNAAEYFVPSFIRCIEFLEQNASLRYRIIFRSFGSDLPDVQMHFNRLLNRLQSSSLRHISHVGLWRRNANEKETELRAEGKTIVGFDEISAELENGRRHLALQDHYEHWAAHRGARVAGKLLLISDAENEGSHRHLFIDDNAHGAGEAHIVDVRRKTDGGEWSPLLDHQARDIYYHEARPYHVIVDDDYYLNLLRPLFEE